MWHGMPYNVIGGLQSSYMGVYDILRETDRQTDREEISFPGFLIRLLHKFHKTRIIFLPYVYKMLSKTWPWS